MDTARPAQFGPSFATSGLTRLPAVRGERVRPDFARGLRTGQPGLPGRFSIGHELLGLTPEKLREGSFRDGYHGDVSSA